MRNIINLLKYNIGKYNVGGNKSFYIIGIFILFINTIGTFVKTPILSGITFALSTTFTIIFLVANFIVAISSFVKQISKENGKLLFTFPIKPYEFIIAKILEFSIIQVIIVLITYIATIFSGNSLVNLIKLPSVVVMFVTIVSYIMGISFIVIFLSYIKSVSLTIILAILGGGIVQSIVKEIINSITKFFPYLYMKIGSFVEIDIIYLLLSLGWIIFLVYMAIYHLDRKLDII